MITLSPIEEYIAQVIRKACERAPQHPTARITGGWVRDKILGVPSSDVDVMLDNMTGSEFAKYLGEEVKTAVVKENPERSKHLEVAICTIPVPNGEPVKVEFVNARKEVYKKDSRIPTMKPATYVEDAFRRDLTINALFYNVTTGEIEDPTGQGMSDLQNRIIRAPGDPKTRYFEDPLRVFRTKRFAARYGFNIEPSTWQALCDPEIQYEVFDAIGSDGIFKLARERIGEELIKMADGNNPSQAFRLLQRSGMLEKMLNEAVSESPYEKNLSPFELDQQNPHHDFTVWGHTERVIKNISERYPVGDPNRAVAVFAALFHDAGKLYGPARQQKSEGHFSYHGHEDESAKIARLFLDKFKMHRKLPAIEGQEKIPELIDMVEQLAALHMRPLSLTEAGKSAINRFLRETQQNGIRWQDVMNMAYSDVMAKSDDASKYTSDITMLDELTKTIEEAIKHNQSANVNLLRPVLDGHEIMDLFGRTDAGRWIGQVQAALKEKQLEGPLDKEQAREFVKKQFPQYLDKTVTASTGSRLYFDGVWDRIKKAMDTSPVEAVSLASDMFDRNGQDENSAGYEQAVTLYMKTGLLASLAAKKPLVDEKLYRTSCRIADERIYNPELITLAVSIKMLRDKALTDADVKNLRRAYRMDIVTVSHYLDKVADVIADDSREQILSFIKDG